MPPFQVHSTGLSGIKERIEALLVQGESMWGRFEQMFYWLMPLGDRLFLGAATGDLLVYTLNNDGRYLCYFIFDCDFD